MSDPVSNREIEDVLSSIRRLVSIENRGDRKDPPHGAEPEFHHRPVSSSAPAEPVATAQESEARSTPRPEAHKLVLTPSFRVKEGEERNNESTADASKSDGGEFTHEESGSSGEDSLSLGRWQVSSAEEEPTSEAGSADGIEQDRQDADSLDHVSEADAWTEDAREDTGEDGQWEAAQDEPAEPEVTHEQAASVEEGEDARYEDQAPSDHPEEAIEAAESHDEAQEPDQEQADHVEVAEAELSEEETAHEPYKDESRASEDVALNDRELEARIAEVEAAVAARNDEWEPEAADADDYAARSGEPLPWEDFAADEDEVSFSWSEEEPAEDAELSEVEERDSDAEDHSDTQEAQEDAAMQQAPEDAAEPEAPPRADESAILAAMRASRAEALAQRAATTSRPLAPEKTEDARADRTIETPDFGGRQSGREGLRETAHHPDADRSERGPDDARETDWYSDESTILDEDALRDLVADIVRQELQGSLGERITRNVRKLVRREIHRAMMGQDFD